MTEQEYIDATNLAKARIAAHALSSMVVLDPASDGELSEVTAKLWCIIEGLERVVQTSEGKP